jgi:hypothetical protein
MPTKREREYYAMGYRDGRDEELRIARAEREREPGWGEPLQNRPQPKRKLSAWNKYVKANSKKPRFRYRNGKLNLKKMAIAFRKTPAGRKKRR